MLLIPDGTVMVHNDSGSIWYQLAPDRRGSYVNGKWSTLASMSYNRGFCSSQVLQNGKVMVAGGEYGNGCTTTEIYDPNGSRAWTEVPVPAGLLCPCPQSDGSCGGFRDSSSILLPDGRMMVAPVYPAANNSTVIYDPAANAWTQGPAYIRSQDEASWVKLPNDSILTVDSSSTNSERYIPSQRQWINDANLPVMLYSSFGEIGAGLLLPDGRAFFLGGNGHTAYYTPSGNSSNGRWDPGPDITNGLVAADVPAAMMSNGKILCALSSPQVVSGQLPLPISFYEFDYTAGPSGSFTAVNPPLGFPPDWATGDKFTMLVLPDGNVLVALDGSAQLYVYQPDGPRLARGKPLIWSVTQNYDGSYLLTGTGLNGISQGASFGDDAQMDSNYPLVRFSDGNGDVYYGRTYNWTSTSVMTGNRVLSTEFTLPPGLPVGSHSLVVVANGISSDPVPFPGVVGAVWVAFGGADPGIGTYDRPYNTLALATNAVPVGGSILIKAPGTSSETMHIGKSMSIFAFGGSATIGR